MCECERACAYVFDADNLLDSYVVLVNPVSRDQRMKKTEQSKGRVSRARETLGDRSSD